jgi:outer membrane receptor protein involved in Fe transport
VPNLRLRLLAAAAICWPTVAVAQDEPAALDDIIVTAQKREQNPIEVPIALTAYDARMLDRLGIQNLDQLALFTPGFEVQQQSPNNPGFVMRGVTSSALETAFEPRVSVFQDGVSISKGEGSYVELFDIERVEVAKGPQSTLFGRGALVGALNIIQNKAEPGLADARAVVEAGDFDLWRFEAMSNIPVGDNFAVRLSAVSRQRDGYVDNALGGEAFQSVDTQAFRTSLAWGPDSDASADLILNYQRDRPTGTAFKSLVMDQTDPVTGAVISDRRSPDAAALIPGAGFGVSEYGLDREVWGATLLGELPLADGVTLSSITALRGFDSSETNDPDGLSLPILTAKQQGEAEQWSHEFRLNYDRGGRLTAFGGASVFHYEGTHRTPVQIDERMLLATLTGQLHAGAAGSGLPPTTPAPVAVFGNTAFTAALLQGLVASVSDNRTTVAFDPTVTLTPAQAQALAANLRANHQETPVDTSEVTAFDLFADATFAVTDRLEVSAGLRYTRDERESGYSAFLTGGRSVLGGAIGAARLAGSGTPEGLAQANAILAALQSPTVQDIPATLLPLFGAVFQPTNGNGATTVQSLNDDGLTWRLAGRFALDQDTSLYATYARGRRPKTLAVTGPTAPFGAPQFNAQDAETVDSVELGVKLRRPDQGFSGSAAVYGYAYENFETVVRDGVRLVPANGGSAEAYGLELQGDWAPIRALTLYGTYAYNHARFPSGALDGNHLRQAPDHSASIGATLRFDAPGGLFEVRPTFSWQSKMFFDDDNDRSDLQQPPTVLVADTVVDEVQESFGLLNLTLAYSLDSHPVTFEVFGTNLTDETYFIDAGNSGDRLGLPTFVAGAPRMAGLRLTWRLN